MNEINRPEHRTDNPEISLRTPQQEREFDTRLKQIGDRLDATTTTGIEAFEPPVPEKTLSSPFSRENFREENSFNARAKVEHPELNELKSKCVYDVPSMGTPENQIDRTSKNAYSEEECTYIKDIRDKVDAPTPETKMQKIIGVDTGNIKVDLDRYLNPRDFDGIPCSAHITGCVAKAEDSVPFIQTPQACFENLRLDYSGTDYQNPSQPVYAVRFTDGVNYEIPYGRDFGAEKAYDAPMTGNGFTGSENYAIPEYMVCAQDKQGAIVTNGEIFRINPDGTEELVAKFDFDENKFYLLDEEDT